MNEFENLKKWIFENGGFVHDALELNQVDKNNRFIYAKQIIPKNQKIFYISDKCCITNTSDEKIFQREELGIIRKDIIIIKKFVEEKLKGQKSFYLPYLQSLPDISSFYSHPLFIAYYKQNILEQWKNINILVNILELKCKLLQKITSFFKTEYPSYSEQDVIYAYFIYITRAWGNGLVPLADLFQHSIHSEMFLDFNISEYNFDCQLINKKNIDHNEIIYENYGIYDESSFLFNFGFIENLEKNINDIPRFFILNLSFEFEYKYKNSIYEYLISFYIEKLQLKSKKYYLTNLGISNDLLQYYRIKNLSLNDIKNIDLLQENLGKEMICLENDKNALSELKTTLLNNKNNPKQIELSKEIEKKYDPNTPEYKLAKITIIYESIIESNLKFIENYWLDKI